jgi:hypothetical protein
MKRKTKCTRTPSQLAIAKGIIATLERRLRDSTYGILELRRKLSYEYWIIRFEGRTYPFRGTTDSVGAHVQDIIAREEETIRENMETAITAIKARGAAHRPATPAEIAIHWPYARVD